MDKTVELPGFESLNRRKSPLPVTILFQLVHKKRLHHKYDLQTERVQKIDLTNN